MVQRLTISNEQYREQARGQASDPEAWVALKADQIHYLTRVLRLKSGDNFIAQNGEGQQWLVAIGQPPEKSPVIEKIDPGPVQESSPIFLIAALPKGNSFDEVVRQTTELGVTHICPVIAERTLLKPSDKKLTRWRRIAQEASEQSERVTVPHIFEPMSFRQCLEHPPWGKSRKAEPNAEPNAEREKSDGDSLRNSYPKKDSELTAGEEITTTELRYLCAARSADHQDNLLLADLLAHLNYLNENCSSGGSSKVLPSVALAIGPEGGWTPGEITVAIENGYKVVSLGSVILRAVTAPLTALSLVTGARNLLI